MEVNFSATVMIFACKARHSIREIPDYLLQIPLRAGIVLGSHLKVLTLAFKTAAFLETCELKLKQSDVSD